MAAPLIIARVAAVAIPFFKKHPWLIPAAIIAPVVVGTIIFTFIAGALTGLSSVHMFGNSSCVAKEESENVFWDSEDELVKTGGGCTFSDYSFAVDGEWNYPLGDKKISITDHYGMRILNGVPGFHDAIDISANYGDPVYAIANGKVISVGRGNGQEGFCGEGAYATAAWVTVDHGNGVSAMYFHIDPVSSIQKGDTVKAGQLLGHIANRGYVCGAHLHFNMKMNGGDRTINPEEWFASAGKPFNP